MRGRKEVRATEELLGFQCRAGRICDWVRRIRKGHTQGQPSDQYPVTTAHRK